MPKFDSVLSIEFVDRKLPPLMSSCSSSLSLRNTVLFDDVERLSHRGTVILLPAGKVRRWRWSLVGRDVHVMDVLSCKLWLCPCANGTRVRLFFLVKLYLHPYIRGKHSLIINNKYFLKINLLSLIFFNLYKVRLIRGDSSHIRSPHLRIICW